MKSLLNNSFYGLILMLSILGCRKDSPIPQVNILNEQEPTDTLCDSCQTCKDFPPSGELDYLFYNSGVQYTSPCFNPLNPDEFICIKNGTLIKYEISSQSETVLCNNLSIVSPPQWSKNGWIVFTVFGNFVFKIFENGTGLQQISQGGQLLPMFDTDGNSYICMGPYSNLSTGYHPILNLNGVLIDSVRFDFNQIYTGHPYVPLDTNFSKAYFFFTDHNISLNGIDRTGICYYENDTITELVDFYPKHIPQSMCNNVNTLFYTSYYDDLKVVDINTGEISVFIEGCQTKFYHWLSMSPFGDKILAEKIINKPIVYDNGEVAIEGKHQIWMIDVQTKEETLILGE